MKPVEKPPQPASIEQRPDGLKVAWSDGVEQLLSARTLRLGCPCAACVEEWSGRRIVDEAQVPAGVTVDKLDPVGNYAVAITFSDGHATGIFSWKTLRGLGEA